MSDNTVPRPDILAAMPIPDEIRADMIDMITKSAGTVWQRPAIPPAQRSMMTISVLGTVGRLEELRTHIGMGLDNGLRLRSWLGIRIRFEFVPWLRLRLRLGPGRILM